MSGSERGAVAALVVSHDGAQWLPVVIDGLRSQTVPVDRVVCVDTGSRDESPDLLGAAFGTVRSVPGSTSYPAAVAAGLAELTKAQDPDQQVEWVWLLHDDSTPDPHALEALLAAAEEHPEASVLGPKLREWPSLRRLLEVGITISGTGRRETGLERGEYDQGQHDDVRRVLAVNTAGMLVRRRVLEELGGLDEHLPIFGNDIDFGWRAAAAGHTTLVVPQAVVFHAEAAHRGVRRTPLTGRHTHFQERRAALFTLLVNSRARTLPLQAVRLTLGTVLRVLGFLLVRAPGQALDELAALVSLRPGAVIEARRDRQGRATAPRAEVRGLLAPAWLPYRHGLDLVSDLAAALTNTAADVAERRRLAAAEADPASFAARRVVVEDDDVPEADSGLVARFLSNPVAVVLTLVVAVALVGARHALASVTGGALSPTPGSVGDWWSLHLQSWHPLGLGTSVPAPPQVLPLALLATVLGGSPGLTVSLLMLLAVPFALWGAWRFLRVLGRLVSPRGLPRWVLLLGASTYALVPATSGAWASGRLGVVVATALLPWLAHAALGYADPEADRRTRAAWRTGVLLTLVTAFAPTAWLLAAVLGLLGIVAALRIVPDAARSRDAWAPPALGLGLPLLLLAPWWLPALLHGAAEGLLLDTGRPLTTSPTGLEVLAGRLGDGGAPLWSGVLLVLAAVVSLVPRTTRIPVLGCWVVALVTALVTLALSWVTLDLAAVSLAPGVGVLVAAWQGALVSAVVLGAMGALEVLPAGPRWRAVGALGAAALAVVPLAGLAWFALGRDDLGAPDDAAVPAYMVQSSEEGPEHGILVIRGAVDTGLTWTVRRDDGVTLGEDEVIALSRDDRAFTDTVRTLVSDPTAEAAGDLAAEGIEYVVLASPADGDVAAALDATTGLVQASAEDRATRAWQVQKSAPAGALDGPGSLLRTLLLVLQGAAIVVALVQCAPTRAGRSDR